MICDAIAPWHVCCRHVCSYAYMIYSNHIHTATQEYIRILRIYIYYAHTDVHRFKSLSPVIKRSVNLWQSTEVWEASQKGSWVSPRSTLAIGSIAGVTLMSMEHVGFLWHLHKKSGVGLAKQSLEEILSAKGRTSLKVMKKYGNSDAILDAITIVWLICFGASYISF